MPASREDVLQRLQSDQGLIVAEGYLFEFEQRGYLMAGGFVPEVVLEHPDMVRSLHREFVHAGSEVVLAFTYYAHREKMRLIGREDDLEKINKMALKIAREVADETNTLMAGNICNTTIYNPDDAENDVVIRSIFQEQVEWAVQGGVDFIVAETFGTYAEGKMALEAIQEHGQGLPAVVTFTMDSEERLDIPESCRKLEEAGAAVVGLNCGGGPKSMLPLLQQVREKCKGPIAALPVCYRTSEEQPVFQSLRAIDDPGRTAFPVDLDPWLLSVSQVREFAREAWDLGVRYLGLCCGNRAHYLRALAEEVGRKPEASRYALNMSIHFSRMPDEKYRYNRDSYWKNYETK